MTMKTALIIPIFNQRKYWFKMMSGIEAQTMKPDVVYVMLDRQSEEDYEAIKNMCDKGKMNYKVINAHDIPGYVGRPTEEPQEMLFMTGYRRNQAIDMAIGDGCNCFVMIDGDCVPDKDVVASHTRSNALGYPNISNGRRREEKYGGLDQRDVDPKLMGLKIFNKCPNYIIQNPDLLKSCSITWSCNISMNLPAVNILKKMNMKYYGRGEVFNSVFLGAWGAEDSFLGIQAQLGKILITIINDEHSGIRHIDHPRPSIKYASTSFGENLAYEIEYLNMCHKDDPLDGTFYSAEFIDAAKNCADCVQ